MSSPIALVTGAAGGFGSAICHSLLDCGFVVVATDVNGQALEHLAAHLHSPNLSCYLMDVCDVPRIEAVAQQVMQQFGRPVEILVNNAGIIGKNFCLQEQGPAEAKRIIDINLTGCFNCTSVFSRNMARQRAGRIINIASVAGIWGASGGSAYAASKAGLIKASESWARELGPLNIIVTAIAPGICKTKMFGQFVEEEQIQSKEEIKIVKSIVPVGRLGEPEDVAEVVQFLATCKTNYLNGTVIEMDGGMRVGQL
ncbi:3-oxoacyl-[acyl-carrier-protein] reductase [Bowmanella denitrificans]|uniref:3-oxoacyl-[acyl-carrier-protein] reductase n=1 Tax=Bowmanella denitrificans TaxID=366582 RepID=A0ABN0WZM6_9ALTE|nr:SDR family NAD(P)-dependent oxidoreductase [Bowmanella denitrificans]